MSADTYLPDAPPDEDYARAGVPPHDLDAERAVLGAMLRSQTAVADASEIVKGRDFYRPNHETIFDAVLDVFASGEPVDTITVGDRLAKAGTLAKVGGPAALADLVLSVATTAPAGYYAQIVADAAIRRRLAEAATKIMQIGMSRQGSVDEARNAAETILFEAISGDNARTDYVPLVEVAQGAIDAVEAASGDIDLTGVPSGFRDLDALTNGLHGGQMVVIAARPAVGKSTFALDIARAASIGVKKSTALFSLEMGRDEIGMKILSAEASVQLQHLRKGMLSNDEWEALARAFRRVSDARLFVDDSANMTMADIRAKCRRIKAQHGLDLVVIDYLQLMSSGKKVESRQQEVSEFSRALKLLAKELDVPVIALSQLNRGSEQRSDKTPQMSDLRESGAIEQDADVVILLHREALYERESPREGEADIILAKQRNGPTGTVVVSFQGHYSRFVDMAQF